jgi:hypothetical protein
MSLCHPVAFSAAFDQRLDEPHVEVNLGSDLHLNSVAQHRVSRVYVKPRLALPTPQERITHTINDGTLSLSLGGIAGAPPHDLTES